MIHPMESDDEDEDQSDEDDGKAVAVKDDPQFTLAVTKGESKFRYRDYLFQKSRPCLFVKNWGHDCLLKIVAMIICQKIRTMIIC